MAQDNLAVILMRAGLVDEPGLERARIEQKRWGGSLGRHLVDLNLITEETLVRALGSMYKLPAVSLDPPRMNTNVAKLVPREICERYCLVAFRADIPARALDIAMAEPSQLDAVDEVSLATKYKVSPHIAARSVIEKAITHVFYGGSPSVGAELDLLEGREGRDSGGAEAVNQSTASPDAGGLGERQFESRELRTLDTSDVMRPYGGASAPEPEPGQKRRPSPSQLDSRPLQIADDPSNALEDRVAVLEATLAQTRGALERLLRELIKKKHFSRDEVMSFLREP